MQATELICFTRMYNINLAAFRPSTHTLRSFEYPSSTAATATI